MSIKFDTCKHKSAEQYTRNVKICCGRFEEITGYDCPLRQIYPLNSEHCENCSLYQTKE
jgi:hypothetical protein